MHPERKRENATARCSPSSFHSVKFEPGRCSPSSFRSVKVEPGRCSPSSLQSVKFEPGRCSPSSFPSVKFELASDPSSSNQAAASKAKQCPAKQPAAADSIDHSHDWQGETVMEMFPDPDDNTEGYTTEELEDHYLGLWHREAFLKRCGGMDPTEWFNEQARQAWAEEEDYII